MNQLGQAYSLNQMLQQQQAHATICSGADEYMLARVVGPDDCYALAHLYSTMLHLAPGTALYRKKHSISGRLYALHAQTLQPMPVVAL